MMSKITLNCFTLFGKNTFLYRYRWIRSQTLVNRNANGTRFSYQTFRQLRSLCSRHYVGFGLHSCPTKATFGRYI